MEPVQKTVRSGGWLVVAIIAVVAAAILLSLAPAAQATTANLPPRPTRTPTPTPTPIPLATFAPSPPSGSHPAGSGPAGGASIELRIRLAPGVTTAAASKLWTIVQWQDSAGGWHAVEGWQGTPDQVAGGVATKAWWLPAGLFCRGPFRWIVLDGDAGQRLAASAGFSLPSHPGETLLIEVTLTP